MKKLFALLPALFCLLPFISSAQSVGINTTGTAPSDPKAMLEVKKSLYSKVKIRSLHYTDTAVLELSNRTSGNSGTDFLISANRESGLFFTSASDLTGNTNDSLFTILTGGNVGIGIKLPQNTLHVHDPGSSNSHLRFTHNTTGIGSLDGMRIGLSGSSAMISNLENSNMLFATNNTTRVLIDATGNVGIGNFAPTNKLDVAGNVNISGLLKIDNSTGLDGQALLSNGTVLSPSWQTISQNPQEGFHVEQTAIQTFDPLVQTRINFHVENFDDGGDFNIAGDSYTVPTTGVYHFDVQLSFFQAAPGNYQLYLDNNMNLADGEYARSYVTVTGPDERISVSISITLRLTVGEFVLAHFFHTAAAPEDGAWGFFSGYRVY